MQSFYSEDLIKKQASCNKSTSLETVLANCGNTGCKEFKGGVQCYRDFGQITNIFKGLF